MCIVVAWTKYYNKIINMFNNIKFIINLYCFNIKSINIFFKKDKYFLE